MGPESIIVVEVPVDGPTRRTVYNSCVGGYEVDRQLWRLAVDGWWTTETEQIADVRVSLPGGQR